LGAAVVFSEYIVLGGGLSGLGFNSVQPSLIVEKSDKLGGHASSFEFNGHHFDYGAHICHSRSEDWLRLLDLDNCSTRERSMVANYDGGSWIGYPVQNNLRDLPEDSRSVAYKQITNNIQADALATENYLAWCNSSYGHYLTDRYYRRFTNKYWRTPMEEMSTNWLSGRVLPVVKELVDAGMSNQVESQAVFNSYRYPKTGGFESLFQTIKNSAENVILADGVVSIDLDNKELELESGRCLTYATLINTIPLTELADKVVDVPQNILGAMQNLKYLNLFVAAVVFPDRKVDEFPDWFYVYDEDLDVSRVMNMSRVSGNNEGPLVLQFETFRRNDEPSDRTSVYESMRKSIEQIIGQESHESNMSFRFSKYSYVVPDLHTESNRKLIIDYLKSNQIFCCGLYGTWEYMWSDKAFQSGQALAQSLR
jgi:protoporphyrinogen oxidase